MTRYDYDTIFQRVFCVTLMAIALTFIVILTDVFIEIDGLITGKDKDLSSNDAEPIVDNTKHARLPPNAIVSDDYKTEKNYEEEIEDSYRSKRSLDSQNFRFHFKNPKIKSVLTSKLASLLEELDHEEDLTENKDKVESIDLKPLNDGEKKANAVQRVEEKKIRHSGSDSKEDMLHLAMHNILLQGIIGNMNLSDVYKKIHQFVKNFKKPGGNVEDKNSNKIRKHFTLSPPTDAFVENVVQPKIAIQNEPEPSSLKIKIPRVTPPPNVESKFFEELAKCDKLQNDITEKDSTQMDDTKESKKDDKLPDVMIKTIIDITSNKQNHNDNSNENLKGIIQLIYNGKPLKFSTGEEDLKPEQIFTQKITEPTTESSRKSILNDGTKIESQINEIISNFEDKYQANVNSESYLTNLFEKYIKNNPKKVHDIMENIETQKYKTRRYKRQIKIRYENSDADTEQPQLNRKNPKSENDELYVEIETHLNSKGLKGKKKKKMIRNLIQKIQNAIHSDIDTITEEKKKKHKHYYVKKRMQYPVDKNSTLFVNKVITYGAIVKRQSDPISKSVKENKFEGNWEKPYYGPRFLTSPKVLNSAELGEVGVEYNKVIKIDGIPQRLQKSLNTEMREETDNSNTYFDLGNPNFFIKNLDGAGLSLSFNQYTDVSPDPETMKVFTGLENFKTSYHQSDENDPGSHIEKEHDISKRDASRKIEHVAIRRSINDVNNKDYHSNEYKFMLDCDFLPYDNYEQIIEDKNKKVAISRNKNNRDIEQLSKIAKSSKNINNRELPVIDDNIFYKKLKSSETLSLASMLNRKKRAITIKKISNLRNRIRLNKYRHSKKIVEKNLILNRKRSKRQIEKIRIRATDSLPTGRQSLENIFLISNENLFANRATTKEIETPKTITDIDVAELKSYNNFHNIPPISNSFENKFRLSSLMFKYPHILMEDIPKSNEKYDPVMVNKIEIKPYTDIEMHKSINTTYDKNGVLNSSLDNVSEISKVEKFHRLLNNIATTSPLSSMTKMVILLKQHKKIIDEQLELLKKDKLNLKETLSNMHQKPDETFEFGSIKPPLLPQISQCDIGKLLASALMNLQSETTTTETTAPITTVATTTEQQDEKTQMINKFQENENLTYEILHKIDKNMEMMQKFLEKLPEKITGETVTHASLENKPKSEDLKFWTPFTGISQTDFFTNNTGEQIPLVYAFQQHFNADKPNFPLASVIYHGHINSKDLQAPNKSDDLWNPLEDSNGNQTRSFIDSENKSKIDPPKNTDDSDILSAPKNNTNVQ